MDFELKSVSLDQSSRLSLDALLVAVPDGLSISASADNPLSRLISQALAPGGLEEGVGKLLVCFRPAGIKAARVVLVRTGQSRPSDVKKAIAAAAAQVRQPGTAKVGLMLSTLTDVSDALPAAVQAMSTMRTCFPALPSKPHRSDRRLGNIGGRHKAGHHTLSTDRSRE